MLQELLRNWEEVAAIAGPKRGETPVWRTEEREQRDADKGLTKKKKKKRRKKKEERRKKEEEDDDDDDGDDRRRRRRRRRRESQREPLPRGGPLLLTWRRPAGHVSWCPVRNLLSVVD
jgi:sRNA-binding protein